MASQTGRSSAAQTVYSVTKELILSGELAAGTLISEGEIAERVRVSRTPVREAFLRLESEELLALHPKRGAVVVPVPPGEAADVLELRQALEQSAAERIVRDGLTADREGRLRELIAAQRERAEAGDVHGFAAADEAFHRGIVEASGNRLASRFYSTLGDRQRRMSVSALRPRPERLHVLADEHETLLGHLLAGAADTFGAALRAHLTATHGVPGRPGGDH
ncbi:MULTISPECIES: GntR family transcriptional regulator [Streptomyces]|nr:MULTISPECIES: GntR family transcriptional regulator [Streptomyces]MBW8093451.1 GntR family transcriptional regulator [Streptomyces hygroscopicus subsp. hygroscopicus]MCO8302668.1 GntR family transcriptional regulator [Streptomyces sp. RKCA744]MDP9611497.1 DNA-binding GntR family transcriptional regulator [Streptomyces demainii]